MKRSREIIIEGILETCKEPATKTRVVYQANLNFRTVKPYLDLLIKSGLLEASREKISTYKTTEKGMNVLGHLKALRAQFESTGDSEDQALES